MDPVPGNVKRYFYVLTWQCFFGLGTSGLGRSWFLKELDVHICGRNNH